MFSQAERQYVEAARVGRLATANAQAEPHAVPICFALVGDRLVTPIDEKPQQTDTEGLRRSRDIRENSPVAVVVDHYTEDWSALGWVQVRGTAHHVRPEERGHAAAVSTLREKYDQYADHDLLSRPVIEVEIRSVLSWGDLDDSRVASGDR